MAEILILDPEAPALAAAVAAEFERQGRGDDAGRRMAQATSPAAMDAAMRRAEVLLAPPDMAAEVLDDLPALRWVQSTWAGVAPVLGVLRARPPGGRPLLTAARGIFGPRMAEYVFGWLAAIERRLLDYHRLQQEGRWQRLEQHDLAGRTLLLLGTGSIGAHLAAVAAAFGMQVTGISRRGRPVPGIARVGTLAALHEMLSEADYVVSSLPDTPQTRHLMDASALAAMRAHAILVNVGRGPVIDDEALVAALSAGHLRGAVLDVFHVEPLPPGHPFWQAPRLYLTPHVAAFTPLAGIARLFAENLLRHDAGEPLHGAVDVEAGY